MVPNILLLDCSSALKEKLERQGFSVTVGTIGFPKGRRKLPSQLYESDVIIYSPSSLMRKETGSAIAPEDIIDLTPEYSFSCLDGHMLHGATVLALVNHVGDGIDHNALYRWIPLMPELVPTKDQQISVRRQFNYCHAQALDSKAGLSFLDADDIARPIRFKLKRRKSPEDDSDVIRERNEQHFEIVPLLHNKNRDVVGLASRIGDGYLFVLPTFTSNDDIIESFLRILVPGIYGLEMRITAIDSFISPEQAEAEAKVEKLTAYQHQIRNELGLAKERVAQAKLLKIKTIHQDATAVLILKYYDMALHQPEVALFFLYKLIEALETKYGGEAEAKRELKNNEGWNFIGKVANASYGDVRHAPKPGEKIKSWSKEEVDACLLEANSIIKAYFEKLF